MNKKLIGLLFASLTVGVLMAGCNKPVEGDPAGSTAGTTASKPVTGEPKKDDAPTTSATTGTSAGTAGTPGPTTGK